MTPEELEQKAITDFLEYQKQQQDEDKLKEIVSIKLKFPDAEWCENFQQWKLGNHYFFAAKSSFTNPREYHLFNEEAKLDNMYDFGAYLIIINKRKEGNSNSVITRIKTKISKFLAKIAG